jgi:hypothetical protein
MVKKIAVTLLALAASTTLFAQNQAKTVSTIPSGGIKKQLQLHAGTQGFGVDFKYGLNQKMAVRAGISSTLGLGVSNVVQLEGLNANNKLKAHFSNVHVMGDYNPFKTSSFRITAGVAYLFEARGNLHFIPQGTYTFDGMELTGEEVGDLTIDLSWKGVAPYIGVGFFKTSPDKLLNINMDVGTYYLNAPKSTIVGTKLLADNYQLEPQLDKNMSSYRFLPLIQINLSINIDKLLP